MAPEKPAVVPPGGIPSHLFAKPVFKRPEVSPGRYLPTGHRKVEARRLRRSAFLELIKQAGNRRTAEEMYRVLQLPEDADRARRRQGVREMWRQLVLQYAPPPRRLVPVRELFAVAMHALAIPDAVTRRALRNHGKKVRRERARAR